MLSSQSQIGIATKTSHSGASHEGSGIWDKVKNFFEGNGVGSDTTEDGEKAASSYGTEDVHHSLGGLSIPEGDARYFNTRLSRESEGTIVTVSADGREEEALQILEANGADLGKDAAQYEYDVESPAVSNEQNIKLYGEVLRVNKDRISRGEVRLQKEVHTTMQSIEVPVTREELVIRRVPASGEVTANATAFSEDEIRIPLSEERASIEKQIVLREEVLVGKKEVAGVETFDEKVRHEDLKIDQDAKHKSA